MFAVVFWLNCRFNIYTWCFYAWNACERWREREYACVLFPWENMHPKYFTHNNPLWRINFIYVKSVYNSQYFIIWKKRRNFNTFTIHSFRLSQWDEMLCIDFLLWNLWLKVRIFFLKTIYDSLFIHTDSRIENDAANIFTIGLHAYFIPRGYYQSSIYIIFAFIELESCIEIILIFRQYLKYSHIFCTFFYFFHVLPVGNPMSMLYENCLRDLWQDDI